MTFKLHNTKYYIEIFLKIRKFIEMREEHGKNKSKNDITKKNPFIAFSLSSSSSCFIFWVHGEIQYQLLWIFFFLNPLLIEN